MPRSAFLAPSRVALATLRLRAPIGARIVVVVAVALATIALAGVQTGRAADAPITKTMVAGATRVTVYRGRAWVTRGETASLANGRYELVFENLPESVAPETIRAQIGGTGVRLLDLRYQEKDAPAATARVNVDRINKRLETLHAAQESAKRRRRNLEEQNRYLDALMLRSQAQGSEDAGTTRIDVAALQTQYEFVAKARSDIDRSLKELDEQEASLQGDVRAAEEELEDAKSAPPGKLRAATASIEVIGGGTAEAGQAGPASGAAPGGGTKRIAVELSYVVEGPTWSPTYRLRATYVDAPTQIEYDALVTQNTGEPWNGVALTLSTGAPNFALGAPQITASVITEDRKDRKETADEPAPSATTAKPTTDAAGAAATPAAEPLPVVEHVATATATATASMPSKKSGATQVPVMVITMDAAVKHVAQPAAAADVYVRADLKHAKNSPTLLAGPMALFWGDTHRGAGALARLQPGDAMTVPLGIDADVETGRALLAKDTVSAGFWNQDEITTLHYTARITNRSGHRLDLELWDRVPKAGTQTPFAVRLTNTTRALCDEKQYVKDLRPAGLLKWLVTLEGGALPAQPGEAASEVAVNFDIEIRHPRGAKFKERETQP